MGILSQVSLVIVPLICLAGVAAMALPPEGVTLKFGVGFGGLAVAWFVVSLSGVLAAPVGHDKAFSLGRKGIAFQFALAAALISAIALTPVSGQVLVVLHIVNAVAFFVIAILASSAAPVVADMGKARQQARNSAATAQAEASALRARVEASAAPNRSELVSLARSIHDAVENMGTRAGVDLANDDEDIAAMIRAVNRGLNPFIDADAALTRDQLLHCQRVLHEMLAARDVHLKAVRG